MEENREILIFSNKKRIKQQHEQNSLCSQRISELPDFHSMTHLQSKQYLSSYHNHKHISLYKWFHICDGIYHTYMYMPVAIIFWWYVLCKFGLQFLEHSWMQPDEVGVCNQWYRSYPISYSLLVPLF